ncbi:MAG: mannose-1-phosphate guanylyltransferase [Bacteroidetes bacterium]|nr:mannose-1-phosphate guanylyltransferase [Bacteroidota bacterium]
MNSHFYTVIMAGGVGSRFWPLSKQKYPKQFLDVLNTGRSLFQATYERFAQICPRENIYIVANKDYSEIIREQIPGISDDVILAEPIARNTAPCVAYAAYKIKQKDPLATMVVAPSDHLIMNEGIFLESIGQAMDFASQKDVLVTLGIKPNRPDTGYGYIQFEDDDKNEGFFPVKTFTEKPSLEIAESFVESGEFLWNAGIFIWNVQAVTLAIQNHLPEVASCFDSSENAYYTASEEDFVTNAYADCPTISIDYGIMEKADNVFVQEGDFGWSDIGTWNSLFQFVDKDKDNNAIKGKFVFTRNTKDCIINISDDKLLAVNNVKDLIIVESENIILVADKSQEQDIRHVVNEIKSKYREKFI